jgi:hypothetical protein
MPSMKNARDLCSLLNQSSQILADFKTLQVRLGDDGQNALSLT